MTVRREHSGEAALDTYGSRTADSSLVTRDGTRSLPTVLDVLAAYILELPHRVLSNCSGWLKPPHLIVVNGHKYYTHDPAEASEMYARFRAAGQSTAWYLRGRLLRSEHERERVAHRAVAAGS